MLAAFLVPDFGNAIHGFVTIPPAIAEISMVAYQLVVGVKTPKPGAILPSNLQAWDVRTEQPTIE